MATPHVLTELNEVRLRQIIYLSWSGMVHLCWLLAAHKASAAIFDNGTSKIGLERTFPQTLVHNWLFVMTNNQMCTRAWRRGRGGFKMEMELLRARKSWVCLLIFFHVSDPHTFCKPYLTLPEPCPTGKSRYNSAPHPKTVWIPF